jgi:hypothetical protein
MSPATATTLTPCTKRRMCWTLKQRTISRDHTLHMLNVSRGLGDIQQPPANVPRHFLRAIGKWNASRSRIAGATAAIPSKDNPGDFVHRLVRHYGITNSHTRRNQGQSLLLRRGEPKQQLGLLRRRRRTSEATGELPLRQLLLWARQARKIYFVEQ